MAPHLPPQAVLQLNPMEWPVWLLCTSLTLGVFSVVALLAHARLLVHEEQRRLKDQQEHLFLPNSSGLEFKAGDQEGQYELMWSFPEKEDKAARFRRWAEVLRFKPREARPPISLDGARLDVKVALEVFYKEAQAAGVALLPQAQPAPEASCGPESQRIRVSELEDEGAALLRERVKERILQFLIESGPPKGLIPIKEEDRSAPSTPSAVRNSQGHACVDVHKLMESMPQTPPASTSSAPSTPSASTASTPRSGSMASRPQSSPRPPPALALDAEPVLRTDTGEAVTRELLWAVLARIHAEAQAAASAAVASVASASGPSVAPEQPFTKPLLGAWRNPLQVSC